MSFVVELGFYPNAHAIPTAAAAIEQVHQLVIDPAAVLEHGAKRTARCGWCAVMNTCPYRLRVMVDCLNVSRDLRL